MGDQMFRDLTLSRDKMKEYHARTAHNENTQKLTVMVLQRSVWPFSVRKKAIDLPDEVGYHFPAFF